MNDNYTPKINEPCECHIGTAWAKITPIFIGSQKMVYLMNSEEGACDFFEHKFRPTKTPEAIKRDEGIAKAVELFECFNLKTNREIAEVIVDAGYHNGPEVGERISFNQCFESWLGTGRALKKIFENYSIHKKLG